MNVLHALAVGAAIGLSLFAPFSSNALAQAISPQPQSVAFPVAAKAPATVECRMTLAPTDPISAVAFSPDGKKLAVGGHREVLLWDLETAALVKRVGSGQIAGRVGAVAFLPDGQLAVGEGTPYGEGAVWIFNLDSGQPVHTFEEPKEVVYSVAVSPDGKFLAAGGADSLARVWSIADKTLVATLDKHTGWVLGVSFSPDSKFLATAGEDRNVWVWDTATWESTVKLREDDTVHSAVFGADGKSMFLAVGGPDKRAVSLRRTDNVNSIRPITTGAGMPLGAVWAGKTNRIYLPCSDGTVKICEAYGRITASLSGHHDWVYGVAVNADATRLASASGDGTVKLWNLADNQLLATLVQLAPGSDRWAIVTAQGYLAASSTDGLQWQTANVTTPPDQLTELLKKPELVQQTIAGTKVEAPAIP